MKLFNFDRTIKHIITVQLHTHRGIKIKVTEFTKMPNYKNRYRLDLNPSEFIIVIVEEKTT